MQRYALGASEQEGRRRNGVCTVGDGVGFEGKGGEVGGEGSGVYGIVCGCVDGLNEGKKSVEEW